MKWYWIVLITWTVANTAWALWAVYVYTLRECEWCHRRYIVWTSNSSCKNVFCSYTCNYWDLRSYLAEEMDIDIAEVDAYLSRRGYIHPDLMEVKR